MDKVIIHSRPDGGVSVVWPAPKGRGRVVAEPARVERRMVHYANAKRKDGTVEKLYTPQDVRIPEVRRDETDEEWLLRIQLGLPADASDVRVVSKSKIPVDRTFRDAWRREGAGIVVDMPLARDIHRDRLRAARKPLLEALDREYMKADERADPAGKEEVAARKKWLRDVTAHPAIEAASTPEALKAVWPL